MAQLEPVYPLTDGLTSKKVKSAVDICLHKLRETAQVDAVQPVTSGSPSKKPADVAAAVGDSAALTAALTALHAPTAVDCLNENVRTHSHTHTCTHKFKTARQRTNNTQIHSSHTLHTHHSTQRESI